MKRTLVPALGLAVLATIVSGCASPKIESIDDLKSAYVKAGHKCDMPTLRQESDFDQYSCESDVLLNYFPSGQGMTERLEVINGIGHSSQPLYIQTGENWIIFSFIERNLAPELGGEVTVDDEI